MARTIPALRATRSRSVAEPTTVDVPLRRLLRWLAGFAERHGPWSARPGSPADGRVPAWMLSAQDGASAVLHAPAWLDAVVGSGPLPVAGDDPSDAAREDARDSLVALAGLRPAYGVVLIRRAGYAVAWYHGDEVIERKVGTRHIHGRTAAGGWSQQRYARRRGNQADEIASATAVAAARILGAARTPRDPVPAFLVTGGDRALLAATRAELPAEVAALPAPVHLAVGTIDSGVLAGVPDRVLAVRIDLAPS